MIQWEKPSVYAVKHQDDKIRMNSRSGGMFTALSDFVLSSGGIIYGCMLNDKFEACHIRAADEETRNKMRGSKYIQSRMPDIYKNVKSDLEAGHPVLFSGTPCQVNGLKSFLNREYDQLLLVDIFCHGVASEKVWKSYIQWQEKKYGKCTDANFRDKKNFGWADHTESLTFGKKQIHSKIFVSFYYGGTALRPCCHQCPFKSINRVGDISLADYWEIDRAYPGFNDNKGVSMVFVNNDRGRDCFEEIKNSVEWKQTRLEDSTRPSMFHSAPKSKYREMFWDDFYSKPFRSIAKKYGGYGVGHKIKKEARKIKSKIKKVRS